MKIARELRIKLGNFHNNCFDWKNSTYKVFLVKFFGK